MVSRSTTEGQFVARQLTTRKVDIQKWHKYQRLLGNYFSQVIWAGRSFKTEILLKSNYVFQKNGLQSTIQPNFLLQTNK